MPKHARTVTFALRPRAARATLLHWLYDEIRAAILDGRLSRGSRLPSSRSLARQHRVARGTVVAAYGRLVMEGYLAGSVGSGTYVRTAFPDELLERTVPQMSGREQPRCAT
jgi:GntR family transcriptional regulator/MocR family aminotransferase